MSDNKTNLLLFESNKKFAKHGGSQHITVNNGVLDVMGFDIEKPINKAYYKKGKTLRIEISQPDGDKNEV